MVTKKKQPEKEKDWFDTHVEFIGVGMSKQKQSKMQSKLKEQFEKYIIDQGDKTNGK